MLDDLLGLYGFRRIDNWEEGEFPSEKDCIQYRGWEIRLVIPNGGLIGIDLLSPKGIAFACTTEPFEGNRWAIDYLDFDGAIAMAKKTIDLAKRKTKAPKAKMRGGQSGQKFLQTSLFADHPEPSTVMRVDRGEKALTRGAQLWQETIASCCLDMMSKIIMSKLPIDAKRHEFKRLYALRQSALKRLGREKIEAIWSSNLYERPKGM